MKPSTALTHHRDAARALIARYPVTNPMVFGSVARGEDQDDSDLDLVVDTLPTTSLFDLGGLSEELTALLGVRVDLVTRAGLLPAVAERVRRHAIPL